MAGRDDQKDVEDEKQRKMPENHEKNSVECFHKRFKSPPAGRSYKAYSRPWMNVMKIFLMRFLYLFFRQIERVIGTRLLLP